MSEEKKPRQSGEFVIRNHPMPPVKIDASGWPRSVGPRTTGEFEIRNHALAPVPAKAVAPEEMVCLAADECRELYGVRRVACASLDTVVMDPGFQWFRDTLEDVRESMNMRLIIHVSQVAIFDALSLVDRTSGKARQRYGVVVYGGLSTPSMAKIPTLFITKAGIANPRVRYEEIAHCCLRVDVPSNTGQFLCPLTDHKVIYAGFLRSRSFAECSSRDKAVAKAILAHLEAREECLERRPADSMTQAQPASGMPSLPLRGIVESADMSTLAL